MDKLGHPNWQDISNLTLLIHWTCSIFLIYYHLIELKIENKKGEREREG